MPTKNPIPSTNSFTSGLRAPTDIKLRRKWYIALWATVVATTMLLGTILIPLLFGLTSLILIILWPITGAVLGIYGFKYGLRTKTTLMITLGLVSLIGHSLAIIMALSAFRVAYS